MARGAEQGPVLRLVALGPAAIAAVATFTVARWHGAVGLDFQGGTHLVVHALGDADRALDGVRAALDREDVPEPSVLRRGDDIVIEYLREDRAFAVALADRLAHAPRFAICDVAEPGSPHTRTVRSASGETLAVVEPPLFASGDVRDVQVGESGVVLDLADHARVAEVTGARIGKKLAMVLGDVLLMAPVVNDRIPGAVQISDPGTPPAELATQLRAGLAPALELRSIDVIEHSRPHWQGIPLALGTGVLVIVLALAGTIASPRVSRYALVAAAPPLAWIVAVAVMFALGGILTIVIAYTGALVALPALAAAVLAARAAGDAWPRVNATWPAMIAFAALAFVVPRLASAMSPGPLRAALRFATWPALVAVLATAIVAIALPTRDDALRG